MNIITPKTLEVRPPCAKGYILLISVIIVGAIATSVAVALLFLGAGGSKSAISYQFSNQAKAGVNACVEAALEQIRENASYTGIGSLSFGGGSCTYTVAGSLPKTITASSTFSGVVRRVTVTVSAVNPIISSTWQELP